MRKRTLMRPGIHPPLPSFCEKLPACQLYPLDPSRRKKRLPVSAVHGPHSDLKHRYLLDHDLTLLRQPVTQPCRLQQDTVFFTTAII